MLSVAHRFYQHKSEPHWDWGIGWGHAVSEDLVTWRRLPVALTPRQGGPDTSGCWSGCATTDEEGLPVALYTGMLCRP